MAIRLRSSNFEKYLAYRRGAKYKLRHHIVIIQSRISGCVKECKTRYSRKENHRKCDDLDY
ncbi:MAG: hypothetical protein PUC50_11920 [Bacteroidales bacterium]|nr:hypothetical protein [Bacteroidales bacterium]